MNGPRVRLVVAWYDLWIGFYWDRRARCLYVLPVPCLGIAVEFGGGARPWDGIRKYADQMRSQYGTHPPQHDELLPTARLTIGDLKDSMNNPTMRGYAKAAGQEGNPKT